MNDDHRSYTQPTQLRKESLQTFLASNDQHCPGGGDKGKGMIKCPKPFDQDYRLCKVTLLEKLIVQLTFVVLIIFTL